jgi:D-beta-D-heptose 7-phosphate kinase/D-beta-D-heptose 1-phosphate adenosyltransferase
MMPGRILAATEAAQECSALRAAGRTVVFTNGCFDILHKGHIHVLERAASFGDFLVVGLNTDESVRRLKGPSRPVQVLADRAAVLASLRMVDMVVPFSEDTPARLIAAILPDVLVKGGDYTPGSVVGADTVIASGGRVEIVELLPGYSTSSLVERLVQADGE